MIAARRRLSFLQREIQYFEDPVGFQHCGRHTPATRLRSFNHLATDLLQRSTVREGAYVVPQVVLGVPQRFRSLANGHHVALKAEFKKFPSHGMAQSLHEVLVPSHQGVTAAAMPTDSASGAGSR